MVSLILLAAVVSCVVLVAYEFSWPPHGLRAYLGKGSHVSTKKRRPSGSRAVRPSPAADRADQEAFEAGLDA